METSYEYPKKLAPTPTQTPSYATDVTLDSGESIKVADPAATRAMVSLMDMQAVLGGAASHFGGPAAFAEIMSALHGVVFHRAQKQSKNWYELFQIVNDAGHCENGIYALKANYGYADLTLDALKGFRSIQSQLTGHGEAHLFPEGVYISNGPLGSGLPQAQGLAFADKLKGKDRVTITAISDGGCMEGEARESLAAIPGLAAAGKLAPFVMVISDNNTKLTGRIDQHSYSMAPSFNALESLGWNVISVENGHGLQSCVAAVESALDLVTKDPTRPVALHVKTIKGYGTKKTEASSSGAHGFPLKDPADLKDFLQELYGDRTVPEEFMNWASQMVKENEAKAAAKSDTSTVKTEKVQVGISKALIAKKAAGFPIISISSDLPGSTGVAGFQKEYPQASQDVGVAEANMISTAVGLSKEGFIPVVDTFSQFGVTKGALPLIMSALSQGPVIAAFSHAGFQDAADGASHQALSYFAMTSSIPHTDVYCLTSSSEAEALFSQAIDVFDQKRKKGEVPNSSIFFLGRENFPETYMQKGYSYKLGQSQVVFDNTQDENGVATIVASGPLLHQALEAAYYLEKQNKPVIVVNPSIINKPDVATIATCLRNTGNRLITVEDHQVIGGMGSLLTHALSRESVPHKLTSLGVRGGFGQSAYSALELYQKHALDAKAIVEAIILA